MAIEVKHATQATGTDAGNGEIAKAEWNEAHAISMDTGKLLGRSTAGAGAAEEIAIGSGLSLAAGALDVAASLSGKTMVNMTFDGDYTEEVFTITDGASVDLDPSNGTIQLWALGASRSPTASSFANGQSMTLMIDDGAAYAITWPSSIFWIGGAAPTLAAGGLTVIQLWRADGSSTYTPGTIFGALVGDL